MDCDNESRGGFGDCAYFTGPSILKHPSNTDRLGVKRR
jgi:hypothetical protein